VYPQRITEPPAISHGAVTGRKNRLAGGHATSAGRGCEPRLSAAARPSCSGAAKVAAGVQLAQAVGTGADGFVDRVGRFWIEQAHLDRRPVAMDAPDRRPTRSALLAPRCDTDVNVL
jgi:hypothetical protein